MRVAGSACATSPSHKHRPFARGPSTSIRRRSARATPKRRTSGASGSVRAAPAQRRQGSQRPTCAREAPKRNRHAGGTISVRIGRDVCATTFAKQAGLGIRIGGIGGEGLAVVDVGPHSLKLSGCLPARPLSGCRSGVCQRSVSASLLWLPQESKSLALFKQILRCDLSPHHRDAFPPPCLKLDPPSCRH